MKWVRIRVKRGKEWRREGEKESQRERKRIRERERERGGWWWKEANGVREKKKTNEQYDDGKIATRLKGRS